MDRENPGIMKLSRSGRLSHLSLGVVRSSRQALHCVLHEAVVRLKKPSQQARTASEYRQSSLDYVIRKACHTTSAAARWKLRREIASHARADAEDGDQPTESKGSARTARS